MLYRIHVCSAQARIGEAHLEDIVFNGAVDFSDAVFGLPIAREGFVYPGQEDIKDWARFNRIFREFPANSGVVKEFREALEPSTLAAIKRLSSKKKLAPAEALKLKHIATRGITVALSKENLFSGEETDRLNLIQRAVRNRVLFGKVFAEVVKPLKIGQFDRASNIFRYLTFAKDAYFRGTQFYGPTAFDNISFELTGDFTGASFNDTWRGDPSAFSLSRLKARELLMTYSQLPPPARWVKSQIRSEADWESPELIEGRPLVMINLAGILLRQNMQDEAQLAYASYYDNLTCSGCRVISPLTLKIIDGTPAYGLVPGGKILQPGPIWWRLAVLYSGFFFYFSALYYVARREFRAASNLSVFWWLRTPKGLAGGQMKGGIPGLLDILKLSAAMLFRLGRPGAVPRSGLGWTVVWVGWVVGLYMNIVLLISIYYGARNILIVY